MKIALYFLILAGVLKLVSIIHTNVTKHKQQAQTEEVNETDTTNVNL
jgi:hypothetical protein